MATYEEVDQKLLDKIGSLADAVATQMGNARQSANLALAANHLAEARAWLNSRSQAHGGTSNAGA